MNKKTYFFKNSFLFALNVFGTKLISFVLVPLYTSTLSTSEYGIVDLISTVVAIVVPLITFNIGESVMRFSLEKDADFSQIVTIGILIAVISPILTLLILIPLNSIETLSQFSGLFFCLCITQGISQIFICYLRGREKLLSFAIGNMIHSVCFAVFNVLLLLNFKWKIKGYFLAMIYSNLITIVYSLLCGSVFAELKRLQFNRKLCKQMLAYSVFLIPNSLMWWITDSSDRVMLSSMVGYDANGICAVAYKIPSLLAVFASVLNQAWFYSAVKEKDDSTAENLTRKMFSLLTSTLLVTSALMVVTVRPFFKIYVSADFFSAWKYVPVLIVAYIFNSLATFLGTSYSVHKNSKSSLFSSIIGATTNIVLNFILIPFLGILGATIATCASYFAVFLFRIFNTRKYVSIKIRDTPLIFGLVVIFGIIVMIYFNFKLKILLLAVEFILLIFVTRDLFQFVLLQCRAIAEKVRGGGKK